MNMRKKLDISAYLVVGPENTLGRPVGDIIRAAVENGFTCLQIRSKTASARALIALCREAAAVLQALGKAEAKGEKAFDVMVFVRAGTHADLFE